MLCAALVKSVWVAIAEPCAVMNGNVLSASDASTTDVRWLASLTYRARRRPLAWRAFVFPVAVRTPIVLRRKHAVMPNAQKSAIIRLSALLTPSAK